MKTGLGCLRRVHLFLLLTGLGFFNPITLLLFKASLTFIVVVPCTLMLWLVTRWDVIKEIQARGSLLEVLVGVSLYLANVVRNVALSSGRAMFGLFDMLVAFVSVCIITYGLRGLRHFTLPIAYLSILILGYQLEFMVPEIAPLQNFLAQAVTSTLNLFGVSASADGSVVTLHARDGVFSLIIDRDCTGLKGVLAYSSLAVLMILDVKAANRRKAICTFMGLAGTFAVNFLRLFIIFLVCYLMGLDAALALHTYLGYGLFILWIIAFWLFSLNYLSHGKGDETAR